MKVQQLQVIECLHLDKTQNIGIQKIYHHYAGNFVYLKHH